VPTLEVAQPDALAMSCDIICEDSRQQRLLRMLFRKSGVAKRRTVIPWKTAYQWNQNGSPGSRGPGTADRMALYERHAPPLAIEAGRQALGLPDSRLAPSSEGTEAWHQDPVSNPAIESMRWRMEGPPASLPAAAVTHLITVSCTGFSAPGIDLQLQHALGLPATVQRVHVGFMGCHGAINALRVARGLAAADPDAVILVVAVELCSLHYRMTWEDDAMVGNALFADGAAAALIVGQNHRGDFSSAAELVDTASIRIPDSVDQMSWRIGDHGFDMTLTGQVPTSIAEHLCEFVRDWLQRHTIAMSDVADWIVHPGGPRILDATERALGLGERCLLGSRAVLNDLGNMSSPTVLFVLLRSLATGVRGPRVVLAFGPGLVAEAALLR
jgi:predicted naringenin-chalcone synthase